MTDSRTGELLERATADLRPTTDLVAGGIAVGRRRRRRGLVMTAGGTLAAVAVGGALVVSLAGGTPAAHDHGFIADQPSTAPNAPDDSAVSNPVTHQQPQADPGPFPVASDAMASTLAGLLQGTVSDPKNDQYRLSTPEGWQSGGVDFNGATVSVSYQRSTGDRCDGDLQRGDTSCTALGGGYFLATYQAEITTKGEGKTGVRDVGVTYYTPDGFKINATASNATSADPTHPSMADPVLGLDQLTAIAESPAWQ